MIKHCFEVCHYFCLHDVDQYFFKMGSVNPSGSLTRVLDSSTKEDPLFLVEFHPHFDTVIEMWLLQ